MLIYLILPYCKLTNYRTIDRSVLDVSVPMIFSDFESRDARGHCFQTVIPFYVDNYQIRQYNTCGVYFYGSATPLPSFGVPFCLGLYIQPLTQKFDVATGDCMHSYNRLIWSVLFTEFTNATNVNHAVGMPIRRSAPIGRRH